MRLLTVGMLLQAFCGALGQAVGGSCHTIEALTRIDSDVLVLEGTAFHVNQVAVRTEDGVLLVDSGLSPEYAGLVRDTLQALWHAGVSTLVLTHHHWDHAQGHQAYPQPRMIAHAKLEAAARRQGQPADSDTGRSRSRVEAGSPRHKLPPPPSHILENGKNGFETARPHVTLADSLELNVGGEDVKIYATPFHSDNDLTVVLPRKKVMMIGDQYFKKGLPVLKPQFMSGLDHWVTLFSRLLSDDAQLQWVVPGHFEIMTAEEARMKVHYVSRLKAGVKRICEYGLSLAEAQEAMALERVMPEMADNDITGNEGGSLHEGNVAVLWAYYQAR